MALAKACSDAQLGLAVVVSDSGEAANLVTKYRPTVPLVVVSSQPPVISQRELHFGQVGWAGRVCCCIECTAACCHELCVFCPLGRWRWRGGKGVLPVPLPAA